MPSPLKPEFDGPNLRIVLPLTVTAIDVEADLYSQWKEWAQLADNMKFPPAFRTIGGDPLTPGISAGAYFFLQNQDGWRIRPPEEDTTIFVDGNLAPEDSSLGIVVPTLGTFRVLLLGLQPITQSVSEILTQTQEVSYSGRVVIDIMNGTAGTTFPVGTASEPVNNLADAFTIASNLGVREYFVRGALTLDRTYTDWTFIGLGTRFEDTLDFNGFDVSGSRFANLSLTGTTTLTTTIQAQSCALDVMSGVYGLFSGCGVRDDIVLAAGQSDFVNCYSAAPGSQIAILDLMGNPCQLFVRGFTGVFSVSSATNTSPESVVSLDLKSARATILADCDISSINIRGVGSFTNLSSTTQVNKAGLVDSDDVKLIKALTAGEAEVSLDDLTVTIYDPDVITSPRTVLATYSISSDGRIRLRTS